MPDFVNSLLLPLIVTLLGIYFEYFVIKPMLQRKGSAISTPKITSRKSLTEMLLNKRFVIFCGVVIAIAILSVIININSPRVDLSNISQVFQDTALVNGTLGAGESAQYKFSATTEDLVTIKVRPIDGFRPVLILYTDNGKEIERTYDYNGLAASIGLAPTPNIVYIISVHGVEENNSFTGGSFILEIQKSD